MKLLDVKAVLDREKHIQQTDPEREVLKECDDETTSYAILSHRWGDGSEVGYKEMTGLIKMEEQKKDKVRKRDGYQKIIKSCEQAEKDGYAWVWIDTCCINKQSSSELSEAINSMYRWYQNAGVCYAYLNDVDESTFPTKRDVGNFPESNGWPEWFVRGWTLQELVAPKKVEFFNKDWVSIGNKWRLAPRLEEVTGIPCEVLKDGLAAERLSVAQIMSWAAERETTRVEDRAYSLMGLFGVNMPMLYGEGRKAFERLQLEIIRISSDQSIFAWNPQKPRSGSVLAEDPSDFRGCRKIKKLEPDEFVKELVEYIDLYDLGNPWHIWLNWHKISTNPIHWCRVAWLKRRAQSLSQQLHTFSVNSAGIQVCLPITPSRDSPLHFRAILACTENDGWGLATIDLVFSGSSYDKSFGITGALKTLPVFKTLYLTHHQDANETRREFTLDDKHALYHGFTRRGVYPRDFIGDTATLSSRTDDLIVVVYANDCAGSRFALGLGCYRGQGWMDVVYDDRLSAQGDFGKRAYDRMWSGRAKYQSMAEQRHRLDSREPFIKHVHLPRSIWAAKIIYRRWKEKDNFNVVLDVEQCAGCCDGPCQWSIAFIQWSSLDRPGIMNTHSYSYELQLDGCEAQFERCSGQWVALGDYGDYSCRTFTRTGNIFEDMRTLGINPMDSVYRPVVSRISSGKFATNHRKNWNDLVVANNSSEPLVLCEPKGLSLPANEHFALLLKALSTRAAGKTLVISVVQCSDFYRVDDDGKRIDDDKRRHSGDNCASDNGNDSTEPRILTPLCAVGRPQVWEKKSLCSHRWQQLGIIREHFYALVNMVPSLIPFGVCPR
ncbi:heterokaryon incompatibility protein-domain-containing protein [Pisolithus orientalis]|uniref:heterokaryon incompatibility protein-domain-containing protein n=1 Tax=Pisolithus orientalis TaxID=936130 RepID=UPI00222570D3|nr:heterokaryon incompatibility protein-domain-containing protein [Pisolithus orientalis]KAI5987986.1 heterokaryon incompatibility protein-domain-containing protein [Pisolithus orientalis]